MLLVQNENHLDYSVPYTDINDVVLWQVDNRSLTFVSADGSHNAYAHNLYLISDTILTDLLLSNTPCQFVDPALSSVEDISIGDSSRQVLANRIGGWATSMSSMWPGVPYILQGNISAPVKVEVGGSMRYWSQIHGSTRASAYAAMRSHLFEINRNAEAYSVIYSSPVDYLNPVVLGKVRNSLDLAGAREHVEVVAALMFDLFEMIGSKGCRVAIDPRIAYGVQFQQGDSVAFYIDVAINGLQASQARGVGYVLNNPVPWLVSPEQVGEIASVFKAVGLPVRMQLSFQRNAWSRVATIEDVIVNVPLDTPPTSSDYETLIRKTRRFMDQYLTRRFLREMLGESGDPANTPPPGYPSWQDAALQQRITELMDGRAVQYLGAIRDI